MPSTTIWCRDSRPSWPQMPRTGLVVPVGLQHSCPENDSMQENERRVGAAVRLLHPSGCSHEQHAEQSKDRLLSLSHGFFMLDLVLNKCLESAYAGPLKTKRSKGEGKRSA